MKNPITLLAVILFGPVLAPLAGAGESPEPVIIQSEDLEVATQSEATFEVNVKSVPKNAEAILEFTAWFQAPKHAGYYAALRVLWDGETMGDILDRPAEFEVRQSARKTVMVPVRRGAYWSVPVLPYPEASQEADKPYYIAPDEVDVVRFRFRLPKITTSGTHTLVIRNNMREGLTGVEYEVFPTLMLRNVAIQWAAK